MMVWRLAMTGLVAAFAAGAAEGDGPLRIAQLHGVPVKWALDENMAAFLEGADAAGAQDADIFITPEGWLDGYASPAPDSTPERIKAVAQDLESSLYLAQVAAKAKEYGMYICFGFTSLEGDQTFNAAGLWGPDGELIGVYHKTHIQTHDIQYAFGEGLPVWPSRFGPLGMMICADRRWPETARTLRVQGARLILNPTYGSDSEFNLMVMRVRAWENQCFIAFTHPEQSLIVGPGGDVLTNVRTGEPGIEVTEIDLSAAKDNNHILDRRPDLYGPLTDMSLLPPDSPVRTQEGMRPYHRAGE